MSVSDVTGGSTGSYETSDRARRPFLGVGVCLTLVVSLFSVVAFSQQADAQRPVAPNGIVEAAGPDVPVFQDIAPELGIALVSEGRWPYGANFVDFDNDGRLDLFFANHGNPPLLLRQDEWGQLHNIAEGSGISRWGDAHGAAWGDYDNDGNLDMYQTIGAAMGTGQKSNQFYRGRGDGTFVDVTIEAGVTDPLGRGRTASWVDYDNDGDLDLFVTNETRTDGQDRLYASNGDGTFSDASLQAGELALGWHPSGVSWADYDNDGDMDVLAARADEPDLYRNNGDGTFTNVAGNVGITHRSRSAASAWGDYDNDGDLDLFVAPHYYTMVDSLVSSAYVLSMTATTHWAPPDEDGLDFRTDADFVRFNLRFVFRDCEDAYELIHVGPDGAHPSLEESSGYCVFLVDAGEYGAPAYQPGMDRGVYIWQTEPNAWHLRWSAPDRSLPNECFIIVEADQPILEAAFIGQESPNRWIFNRLYRNNGDGTFDDTAVAAGVQQNLNTADATWADFDNDGYLDLYVVNAGDPQLGNQPNFLFLNRGDGTFQEVAEAAGATGTSEGLGARCSVGDLNTDGFPDIFLTNGLHRFQFNGPHQMFLNQDNGNHWLQVRLVGQVSNALGIGARVEIATADGLRQLREANGGIHGSSQDEMILSFGLGQRDRVAEVRVKWPSGAIQTFTDLAVDQRVTVFEVVGLATFTPTPTSTSTHTASPTATCTPSATSTPTVTPTQTHTATPTATSASTPTASSTPMQSPSPTPSPTSHPLTKVYFPLLLLW